MPDVTRDVILKIENGLHLRPISAIVGSLGDLTCDVRIRFGDRTADARSASDLMLLAATCGSPLTVSADGPDAAAAVAAVVRVLESRESPDASEPNQD